MTANNLKTEWMRDPVGIDIRKPRLTWLCGGGERQTAYQVRAVKGGIVIWDSGKVETSDMWAIFGGELSSRDLVRWQVRLWDERGQAGEWSPEASFEMGLLERSDFKAQWIDPEPESDSDEHRPASYLRKTFTLDGPVGSARLYVTCHGLYEVSINGERVGDFVLAPGSSSYDKRVHVQTYDVTGLLRQGENSVLAALGDGWYRSCAGSDGVRNVFGRNIALWFQLEADSVPVCLSDGSWEAAQDGPIRMDDMQQGEIVDARMEPSEWHNVIVRDYGVETLCASNCVPVREHERFPGRIIKTPAGETMADFGQNMAGYIEFTLTAHAGDKIVITHGEALDEKGCFTVENFQLRDRHSEGGVRQQVVYTCREGVNRYKTKFAIFGFRYAKIETDIDLTGAEFTAIAVYSDMERTGWFECGNRDVNRLVENTLWSMKSNFCDVPTDCPTRERAGWTGDVGVFIDTGLYLMDCYPVIHKWLIECAINQYPDGRVQNISPRIKEPDFISGMLAGSVGWGDAMVSVPWALYTRSGDRRILDENYEMMRGWYSYLEHRASISPENALPDLDSIPEHYRAMIKNMPPEVLAEMMKKLAPKNTGRENPYKEYTIESGTDWGEWAEPDVDSSQEMSKPQSKVTTAYYAHTGSLMAEISDILSRSGDAEHYRKISEGAKNGFRFIAAPEGRIVSERQADYVRAVNFGLLEGEERTQALADLNELIKKNGYHLNTGFLSTPALCPVLAENGYLDTAYRLLLQDTLPSWLYEVKHGATTIWEDWDGVNDRGEVKASLNHYSKGAVCGWLFSGVCGIRVENGRIRIAPQPSELLGRAEARYMSPVGEIVSGWSYGEDGKVTYNVSVPANATADVELPDGRRMTIGAGEYVF